MFEHRNLATVLVQRGTLCPGDVLIAGESLAKVRFMTDSTGKAVRKAFPSEPIEVSGWKTLPEAGDIVLETDHEVFFYKFFLSKRGMKSIHI